MPEKNMPESIFEINDEEINVEQIMEQIRQNIKKRKIKEVDLPDLESLALEDNDYNASFNRTEFEENVKYNNIAWNIQTEYQITSHRKIIGRLIVFAKKILRKLLRWYINPPFYRQREFNASVTRSLNQIKAFIDDNLTMYNQLNEKILLLKEYVDKSANYNRLKKLESFVSETENEINNVKERMKLIEQSQKTNSFIKHRLEELEEKITLFKEKTVTKKELEEELKQLKLYIGYVEEELEKAKRDYQISLENLEGDLLSCKKLVENVEDLKGRVYRVEENVRSLNNFYQKKINTDLVVGERLRRIERTLKNQRKMNNELTKSMPSKSEQDDRKIDIDYFMFEQIYRGSREEIKKKQSRYLKYFEDKENILDIGCGRGEFVELLMEQGKTGVKGIDINEDMVLYCQENGLPVELAEGLEYLKNVNKAEFDGIFAAQVIEHLEPHEIVQLIRLSYERLKKNGVLIIETINPQCLSAVVDGFYIDLTHKTPIHPLTLKFILETEGFRNIEVSYFSNMKEKFPAIRSSSIDNLEEVNEAINRLNNLLFGQREYAIIATK
ncbi:MAG: hypothetical protein PWQ82_1342 [Thermosediminibacterales bacterium]|nr:hypothetical protein [Thermosediminibacterales bacterium]MDK2835608.1 hypothetical protein [Thermosediminibacterales bacterium]